MRALWLTLLLPACKGNVDCASLPVDECLQQAQCAVVDADPIIRSKDAKGEPCYTTGSPVAAGCISQESVDTGCFSADLYLRNPTTSECVRMASGCSRVDWEACDPTEVAPAACP